MSDRSRPVGGDGVVELMTTDEEWLNPGSNEALDAGCLCAVLDNGHGRGFMLDGERSWWMTEGCPLHWPAQARGHLQPLERDPKFQRTLYEVLREIGEDE